MDRKFIPEPDFVSELTLSRHGMIEEIRAEFDIVKVGLLQKDNNDFSSNVADRIIVMSLRKLLCERNKNKSVILTVAPDFKMPRLIGREVELNDKLKVILPPYEMSPMADWIPLDEWLDQKIAYFDRSVDNLPDAIAASTFTSILNKLSKADKNQLSSLMNLQDIEFRGEIESCYVINNPDYREDREIIYELFKKAGYYDLTLFNFIKHLADKRGAHIDLAIAPMITVINGSHKSGWTAVKCLALQMIYAATHQITELKDYWPDLKI